jgi:serine/threonine protein kinase
MQSLPRVGSEFASYRLEGVLGRGGMSVVYRAHNLRLRNLVALKILAPELAVDDAFRERFVRESSAAASISHPNIIPIHDAGEYEDLLYIAMRYVEGSDLKELVRRHGPLPTDRALGIFAQVAGALDTAHAHDLIHRDIKPANILVEPVGVADDLHDHVYLADFGLTKHVDSTSGLTHTGQFVGTIDYISPEQIQGEEVDERSDLYSLGCVIFQTLTGAVPYQRDGDAAVLFAHLSDRPPLVSELRPDFPRGVDGVIARALAKSPEDRYPTARELVGALRTELEQPRPRRALGRGEPVPRPADRRPASRPPSELRRPPPPASIGGPADGGRDRSDAYARDGGGRPWLLPVLLTLGAVLVGAVLASAAFVVLRDDQTSATGAGGGTTLTTAPTTTNAASPFPADTERLQRVMDRRLLGGGQCEDARAPVDGIPLATGEAALEAVGCGIDRYPNLTYGVFLYPDTAALTAAFQGVLDDWGLADSAMKQRTCRTARGGWVGRTPAWRHPATTAGGTGALAGYRACFYDADRQEWLMAWTHMRDNGEVQDDHYDVLVVGASPGTGFPTDLTGFWHFTRETLPTPIGKSLTGAALPPPV